MTTLQLTNGKFDVVKHKSLTLAMFVGYLFREAPLAFTTPTEKNGGISSGKDSPRPTGWGGQGAFVQCTTEITIFCCSLATLYVLREITAREVNERVRDYDDDATPNR